MNRKLISLAVAGALGAPGVALAQASTVQIYGTLVMNYAYLDSGTGILKTDMINTHDSNIGFKGEESLGGGLSAWFQCESSFDPTAGGGAGNSWCGRNSAFGMKGNYGNVYLGQWDTPMKITMANFRPFSTAGAFGMGGLMWGESSNGTVNPVTTTAQNAGFTAAGAASLGVLTTQAGGTQAGSSFTRRASNSINYMTPNFSGFQLGLAYTAANQATGQGPGTVAAKPRMYSSGLTYSNGPLILGAGYEKHNNFNPANQAVTAFPVGTTGPGAATAVLYTGGSDRQYNLGAAYTFMGTLKAMAMYNNTKYETGAGGDLEVTAYSLHGDWAFSGPHRIRVGYTRTNDTKGTFVGNIGTYVGNAGAGATSGSLTAIQYAYAFSKRTEINLGYARIGNSVNSRFRLQTLGATNTGQDQTAFNLGVKHSF